MHTYVNLPEHDLAHRCRRCPPQCPHVRHPLVFYMGQAVLEDNVQRHSGIFVILIDIYLF